MGIWQWAMGSVFLDFFELVAERGGLFVVFGVEGLLEFAPQAQRDGVAIGGRIFFLCGNLAHVFGGSFLGAFEQRQKAEFKVLVIVRATHEAGGFEIGPGEAADGASGGIGGGFLAAQGEGRRGGRGHDGGGKAGVGGGLRFGRLGLDEMGENILARRDEAGVGGVGEAEVNFHGALDAGGVGEDFGEVDDGGLGTLLALHAGRFQRCRGMPEYSDWAGGGGKGGKW